MDPVGCELPLGGARIRLLPLGRINQKVRDEVVHKVRSAYDRFEPATKSIRRPRLADRFDRV